MLKLNTNPNRLRSFYSNNKYFFADAKVGSTLYIPTKKLLYINHQKHGNVCPVYIADEDFNKKYNPKNLKPVLALFTGLNAFLFLTGFQILPMNQIYKFFYFNDYVFFTSVFANLYVIRNYMKYLTQYTNRVKGMYLLPGGTRVLIETFDDNVSKLDNLEIYSKNIQNRYVTEKDSIYVNNDNSFKAKIGWGRGIENYFVGKRVYLDYEIFNAIVNRFNIDVSQSGFKNDKPLNIWTVSDKKKVLLKFRDRKLIRRLDRNRLFHSYFLLKKKLYRKKKEKVIKEEFKFY